jgi:hypothetical protein
MPSFSALLAAGSVTATFLLASATSVARPANSRRHDCDEGMGKVVRAPLDLLGILLEWVMALLELSRMLGIMKLFRSASSGRGRWSMVDGSMATS